jgi:hypothetical protein
MIHSDPYASIVFFKGITRNAAGDGITGSNVEGADFCDESTGSSCSEEDDEDDEEEDGVHNNDQGEDEHENEDGDGQSNEEDGETEQCVPRVIPKHPYPPGSPIAALRGFLALQQDGLGSSKIRQVVDRAPAINHQKYCVIYALNRVSMYSRKRTHELFHTRRSQI